LCTSIRGTDFIFREAAVYHNDNVTRSIIDAELETTNSASRCSPQRLIRTQVQVKVYVSKHGSETRPVPLAAIEATMPGRTPHRTKLSRRSGRRDNRLANLVGAAAIMIKAIEEEVRLADRAIELIDRAILRTSHPGQNT
jgi:hypothetical protein